MFGSNGIRMQSNAAGRAETGNSPLESVPRSLNRDLFVRINAAGSNKTAGTIFKKHEWPPNLPNNQAWTANDRAISPTSPCEACWLPAATGGKLAGRAVRGSFAAIDRFKTT